MISLSPIKVILLTPKEIVEFGEIGTLLDFDGEFYDVYFLIHNVHLYLNIDEFEKIN